MGRIAAGVGIGILFMQIAWLTVVPAFGGMDEFDHAYRAASVARGYIAPPLHPAAHGFGDLIKVPSDLPKAAHHACAILPYTAHDDCSAASREDPEGQVFVASSAARYNPVFYVIVGAVARPFTGANALYAMRLATLLICDAFVVASLVVSLRHSRSGWPLAGTLLLCTPIVLESTIVAAPNGVEMSAGIAMWSAALAFLNSPEKRRAPLMWLIAISAATIVTVHTTGTLWVCLFLVAVLMLIGFRGLLSAVRAEPKAVYFSSAIAAAATISAVTWILWRGTNDPTLAHDHKVPFPGWIEWARQLVLWMLQTVGGVPFRDQPLPPLVFAISLVMFFALLVLGWRAANWRERSVAIFISAASLALPLALSMATYSRLGFVWQGRYTLPFACALPLLMAWALDRKRASLGQSLASALPFALGTSLIQILAIMHVRAIERGNWPGFSGLPLPSSLLVLVLTCVGCSILVAVLALAKTWPAPDSGSWSRPQEFAEAAAP